MKKLIIGLVAVGAVLAVRPVVKRKAHKMREHCEQMAANCKQKMAEFGGGGEEAGMPEHCKQMAAQHKEKMARFEAGGQEASRAPEHPKPVAAGNGAPSDALTTA